jgi:hypothetical protein
LWAPILEKAIAKVKGNYFNLASGSSGDALSLLTGAPVFTYGLDSTPEDYLWKEMRQASLVEYVSTATTGGKKNNKN